MKLMIYISEEDYEVAKKVDALYGEWRNDVASRSLRAIAYGTPLPKGHGDLIDRNDLIPDSDYEDGDFYSVSIRAINEAPTIIEAESEVQNDKRRSIISS